MRQLHSDFITAFSQYTEAATTPEIFRKWAGIALCAGALERRVWVCNARHTTFPSLYTLLVGPPGVGKYIIEEVRELWRDACEPGTKTPAFHVAPDSVTKASLMDALGESKRSMMPLGQGELVTYSSLLVAAEEFAILMPQYDLEFIGALNGIYNNKSEHSERRRTGSVRELKIPYPQLNILGGTQPGWLASVFPEEAWTTGLTSRMVMIYASEAPRRDLFEQPEDQTAERQALVAQLGLLSQLYGEARWTAGAQAILRDWQARHYAPEPQHSKLENYNRRRALHMIKLCLVSAISRTKDFLIEEIDVRRAMAWLFEAEGFMPDIFRAMVGRSDSAILEEMHRAGMDIWMRNGKKPIPEKTLLTFLAVRVPSDKMMRLMEVAERAGYFDRVAGQGPPWSYVPKPRLGGVVE